MITIYRLFLLIQLLLIITYPISSQIYSGYAFVKNIESTPSYTGELNLVNFITGVDSKGNIYFNGVFTDSIFLGNEWFMCTNMMDSYLAKSDNLGNIIWSNQIKSNISNISKSSYINNKLYLYGEFTGQFVLGNDTIENNGPPDYDLFFTKLDTNGAFLWTRSFGGDKLDRVSCITQDSTGNLILGGYYSEEISIDDTILLSPNGSSKEALLIKSNPDGEVIWARDFKGPNNDRIYECCTDENLNIYVAGYCFDGLEFDTIPLNQEQLQIFVGKLDQDGNAVWAFQIGSGSFESDNHIVDLKYDNNDCLYLYGFFNDSITISNDKFYAKDFYDIFLIKLTKNGDVIWVKTFIGFGGEYAGSLEIDKYNNIFISGYFDVDLSLDDTTFYAVGQSDIFLAQINENGNVIWSFQTSGTMTNSYLYNNSLFIDNKDIYLGGGFETDAYFDPFLIESEEGFNGYLARYENLYVKVPENQKLTNNNNLELYPNPTSSFVTIDLSIENESPVQIDIFDLHGKILKSQVFYQQNNIVLDISDLNNGIYLLKLTYNQQTYCKRLIRI